MPFTSENFRWFDDHLVSVHQYTYNVEKNMKNIGRNDQYFQKFTRGRPARRDMSNFMNGRRVQCFGHVTRKLFNQWNIFCIENRGFLGENKIDRNIYILYEEEWNFIRVYQTKLNHDSRGFGYNLAAFVEAASRLPT